MDCSNITSLPELIRQSARVNAAGGCSIFGIGSSDPMTDGVDCVNTHHSLLTLLRMALIESDRALAADIDSAAVGDIERLGCTDLSGLETLFRAAVLIDGNRTKVKVVSHGQADPACPDCTDPIYSQPVMTKVLGTFVRVDGEIRIHVEGVGALSQGMARIDCTKDVSALTLVNAALDYDTLTDTWFWKIYEI